MAAAGGDLRCSSLETRNTQEGANEVVDESMRLERTTALCWRFMTLRLQSWAFTPGTGCNSFDQDMGIGLIILLSWYTGTTARRTIACYDPRHANRQKRNDV